MNERVLDQAVIEFLIDCEAKTVIKHLVVKIYCDSEFMMENKCGG